MSLFEERVRPAVPFWTCPCRAMNAAHRADCLWCGAERGSAQIVDPKEAANAR